MKKCMVSIILPVYNKETEILTTLHAICNQTYKEVEVIIVNDGSTDNSERIIKDYFEDNQQVKYHLINTENKGVSSARNKGLSTATGEYVFFMDGDDEIDIKCIEKMVGHLSREDTDLAICGYRVYENGRLVNENKGLDTSVYHSVEVLKLFLLSNIHIYMGNALYKNLIIKENEIEFDEKYKYNEDQVFIYKYLTTCGNVYFDKEKMFQYYRGETSATLKINIERVADNRIFLDFLEWASIREINNIDEIKDIIFEYKIPYGIYCGCENLIKLGCDYKEFTYILNKNKSILEYAGGFKIRYGKKMYLKILVLVKNKRLFYKYMNRKR